MSVLTLLASAALANVLECTAWNAGFLPFLLNTIYFGVTPKNRSDIKNRATIAKLTSAGGILHTTCVGLIQLALGVGAVTSTLSSGEGTSSVLASLAALAGSISVAGKFAATPAFNVEDDFSAVTVLCIADFVCDVAVGGLTCASTFI